MPQNGHPAVPHATEGAQGAMRIIISTRKGRSPSMLLLQNLIRPFGTSLVKPGKPTAAGSPRLTPHRSAKKNGCTVEDRKVEGIFLYDVVHHGTRAGEKGSSGSATKRIYYFAGGGFQSPPSPQHWSLVQMIARTTGAIVTVVSYPLAPHTPAKDSIPMLLRLYPRLFDTVDEQIMFMGDSAGGNVALALMLAALREPQASDNSPPVPHAIFLISPCADAKNDNPAMRDTDKNDPLLSVKYTGEVAEAWAKGLADRGDPLVSPTYGDLDALRRRGVRLDGIVGTWDVLCPDTLVLLEKAAKAGVTGEWLVWDRQMHCFPLIWRYGLKDGQAGADWIVRVIKSY